MSFMERYDWAPPLLRCVPPGVLMIQQDVVAKQCVISVIANQLGMVGCILLAAGNELEALGPATRHAQPEARALVNGHLCLAATMLQTVLDRITAFCEASSTPSFSKYGFKNCEHNFISEARHKIYEPLFQGLDLDDLATRCNHVVQPWLGTISTDSYGLNDIHDRLGKGVLHDMLAPAYNQTKRVVERLGQMHEQLITLPDV